MSDRRGGGWGGGGVGGRGLFPESILMAFRAAFYQTTLAAIAAVSGIFLSAGPARALPPGVVDEVIVNNWNQATGIVFLPDGRGIVWEKAGKIYILENNQPYANPILDITEEVRNYGDHGLLGLALDPDFMNNGHIYLLYAVDYYYLTKFGQPDYDRFTSNYQRDSIGRITRYTLNHANNLHSTVPGSRKILLGESISTGFPHLFDSHSIGTILFGADGSLLAGCGDGASWSEADNGGPRQGSSNTGLADGVITPKEDVGAFRSQLVDCLGGKIIRIDPQTGDGLPGNPFFDPLAPRAAKSRVWAMGFRNPYRWSVRPDTATASNPVGALYVGDVAWYSHEEINIVTEPGQNFGWPLFEGFFPAPEYPTLCPPNQDAANPLFGSPGCTTPHFLFSNLLVEETLADPSWPNPCDPGQQVPSTIPTFMHSRPILTWGHGFKAKVPIFSGSDAASINIDDPASPVIGTSFWGDAVMDGVWYPGTAFGAEYENTYFCGDFVEGWIRSLEFHEGHQLHRVRQFAEDCGQIVCIAYNPFDESLWYISYGYTGASTLHRISASGNQPPHVEAAVSTQYGASPLTVQFSTEGTYDPESGPLTFAWDFGDGSPVSTAAFPTHTFTAPDANPSRFDITLTVTDVLNISTTRKLFVTPNNTPPRARITSPGDGQGMLMDDGEWVPLRAALEDDESLGSLSCKWQAILHHNAHTHPQSPIHECEPDLWVEPHGGPGDIAYYEIQLTVTDPQGLEAYSAVSLFPRHCFAGANELPFVISCPRSGVYFGAEPQGVGPFNYQWQRETSPDSGLFVPLEDGPTSEWGGGALLVGTANQLLAIVPNPAFTVADGIRYRCLVSNACGTAPTGHGRLQVCLADFDCSGFVDLDDFSYFVYAFEAGESSADADGSGFVDTDDFDTFVHAFELGC
ncbi:MAG: PQQ-dependent sugar dehydrogenase [Phycisphaerales bacterium]|nr:PQQ-dependent sugar dehydrogenase [Phycisphaerales bacterium]